MSLAKSLATFRSEINTYMTFISRAFTQDSTGNYILTEQERLFITDSAFLRIFISWETFLEGAFVNYLMCEPSISGRITKCYAQPLDKQHASDMLIGTQKYVDWANPEIVRSLSKLYFDQGDPINRVVSSIQSDLFDLKTIRNAAAHLTITTGPRLDSLASRKLNKPCRDITVGNFILSINPNSKGGNTILVDYTNVLDVAADEIATWP